VKNLWFIYLVECRDKTLYCGTTTSINRRIEEHNFSRKGAKYTKARRPVILKWFCPCESRSEAYVLEIKVKKLTRIKKKQLIVSNNLNLLVPNSP